MYFMYVFGTINENKSIIKRMICVIFLLTLLYQCGDFQSTNLTAQTATYQRNLQASLRLESDDRRLRSAWQADLQVQRIRVTARSRGVADRHREHCFQGTERNVKWSQCLYVHRRQIRKCTKEYLAHESDCLTASTLQDDTRTAGVDQLEKEIRKWRKGYRYLLNTCQVENPGDEEGAQECLVQYMEKDHYNQVIERLMALKLEAMARLHLQISGSVANLEQCLQSQRSAFLDEVRSTMDVLNRCYNITNTNTTGV